MTEPDSDTQLRFSHAVTACLLLLGFLVTGVTSQSVSSFNQAAFLWLPSGFALAGCMLLGWRFALWLLLVSFCGNLALIAADLIALGLLGFLASMGAAAGMTLQALLGAYLLRRYVGNPLLLDNFRDLFRFALFAGFLTCMVSPAIGITVISVARDLPSWTDFLLNFPVWWLGESFGAVVVTPVLLYLLQQARPKEAVQGLGFSFFPLIMVAIIATLVFLSYSAKHEQDSLLRLRLSKDLALFQYSMRENTRINVSVSAALAHLAVSESQLSAESFRQLVSVMLLSAPSLDALSWSEYQPGPRVVLRHLEPLAGHEPLLGTDQYADSHRYRALELARETRSQVSTPLLPLAELDGKTGFIIFRPVYPQTGGIPANLPKGYTGSIYDIQHFMDKTFRNSGMGPDAVLRVYAAPSTEPFWSSAPARERDALPALSFSREFEKAGQTWRLELSPLPDYVIRYGGAGSALFQAVLVVSVSVVVLMLIYYMNSIRREQRVRKASIEARTRSDFLARMSHEIRTPMNGILGMAELLSQTSLTDKQGYYADSMRSSGRALITIIDDILDYSRLDSGNVCVESIPVDLRRLVSEVADLFRGEFRDDGRRELVCEVRDDVDVAVGLDGYRLRQVLINLLGNAVKFTEEGSVSLVITRSELHDNGIRVSVADTGIGIPEDKLNDLFTPFSQVDPGISRRFGGAGLGLSIARQLVQLMGGEISVTSQPGEGTIFWFDLPAPPCSMLVADSGLVTADDAKESPGTGAQEALARVSNRGRVLVVEDNAINMAVISRMLDNLGYVVDEAKDGVQALARATDETVSYRLILMDCEMPYMDGFEATRQLRSRGITTPIVAVTAHAMEENRLRCLQAGMDDVITKPLILNHLRKKIEQWILPLRDGATETGT